MSRLKKLLKKIDEIVDNMSIEEIEERIKIDEEENKQMLSKEEIKKLEELTRRCENCGHKEEVGFCTDCLLDESEIYTIRKLFIDYKQLEINNQKLIENLEEDIEITKKQYGENTLLNIRIDGKLDTLEEILEFAKGEKE